jgi:hypothetical protein
MNIQEVWQSNLEAEMANIRNIIERYPYVAMVLSLDAGYRVSRSRCKAYWEF